MKKIIAVGLICLTITGCSFKIETLYHGKTPVGLDNRQSTQLRATNDSHEVNKQKGY